MNSNVYFARETVSGSIYFSVDNGAGCENPTDGAYWIKANIKDRGDVGFRCMMTKANWCNVDRGVLFWNDSVAWQQRQAGIVGNVKNRTATETIGASENFQRQAGIVGNVKNRTATETIGASENFPA